jgi:AcrR family transcriptional regulator
MDGAIPGRENDRCPRGLAQDVRACRASSSTLTSIMAAALPFGRCSGMTTTLPLGTRRRILAVAEELFGERGYQGTRFEEIARRVGVRKASIFHHFPSKKDLYRAVLDQGFGETEGLIRDTLAAERTSRADRLTALAEACVDLVVRHPARTKILLRQALGDAPPDCPRTDLERLLARVARFVGEVPDEDTVAALDPLAFVIGVASMIAFFDAAGPVVAPTWFAGRSRAASTARMKRWVAVLVRRCIEPETAASGHVAAAGGARS